MDIKFDELQEELQKEMDALVRGVAIESANMMIDLAPVNTGALKASINAAVNSEDDSFNPDEVDPTGESTKAKNENRIKQAKAGDVVNIVVGAPYGREVEEGSSQEAPNGFTKITGESLGAIVARVSQNLKKYE